MILIFEGLDRTGKSTQAKNIKRYFSNKNVEIIHDRGATSKIDSMAHYLNMLNQLYSMYNKKDIIVYDRFHLGEAVYPKLYKDYDGFETFKYVDDQLKSNFLKDAILFLFYDETENLIERDDKKSFACTKESIINEFTKFSIAFDKSSLKKVQININGKSIDEVFNEILSYINLYINDNEKIIYNEFIQPLQKQLKDNNILKNGTVELINASVKLKPSYILNFGNNFKTNINYCKKELNWYYSQSLSIKTYVDDVKIWRECASKDDKMEVNSNYGYLVFGEENGYQFDNAYNHLVRDECSRNAVVIYNRPSIHKDMNENGKHDMICTMYAQFFIRDNKLIMKNDMRSNDLVYGFMNDFYWASEIYHLMYSRLKRIYPNLQFGDIYWNASSLHVYTRHFEKLKAIKYE